LPVNGFFAFRGGARLPPTGWHAMPQTAPIVQELQNPIYEKNAENALSAIWRDIFGALGSARPKGP
jgi:hypothetical protein